MRRLRRDDRLLLSDRREESPSKTPEGTTGEQPDVERMATTAARYGVTILGPTPDK